MNLWWELNFSNPMYRLVQPLLYPGYPGGIPWVDSISSLERKQIWSVNRNEVLSEFGHPSQLESTRMPNLIMDLTVEKMSGYLLGDQVTSMRSKGPVSILIQGESEMHLPASKRHESIWWNKQAKSWKEAEDLLGMDMIHCERSELDEMGTHTFANLFKMIPEIYIWEAWKRQWSWFSTVKVDQWLQRGWRMPIL